MEFEIYPPKAGTGVKMAVYQMDEVTKLYTEDFLEKGLEEHLKKGKEVTFIYLKVKFQKQEHNSLTNMALKDIARIIRNQLRNVDYAVKLKDAILLVLPGIERQQAEKILERIINKVESPGFLDGYSVLSMPKKLITDVFSFPQEVKTKEEIVGKLGTRD